LPFWFLFLFFSAYLCVLGASAVKMLFTAEAQRTQRYAEKMRIGEFILKQMSYSP
jgi:hypothetical protein